MGINMLDMKQNNAQTVFWALHTCKTSTIRDMAQMTGLSYATTGNILNGFVKSGEVMLGEMLSATGGRPSQVYVFNAQYAHVLTVSTRVQGGDNVIHACVGNLYGETVWETEQHVDTVRLTGLESVIDVSLRAYPTIHIVAFSLPGVACDGVIRINDYKELEGVSFTDHFQGKYRRPVVVENDVNAAVFGYGKDMHLESVIAGIYFPKRFNPGAGILADGKILTGDAGYAGEISLLPLDIDWPSLDYANPKELGVAISRLISVFSCIINPGHMVLYGDFFSDDAKKIIEENVSARMIEDICPRLVYRDDFESDIIAGLMAQAISAYQRVGA